MKKNLLYLSIIIPVYNAEKFLETAILSIYKQIQPWVEVILVDDGSLDNSSKICKQYESNLIRYIKISNSGAGYARNIGIDYAKGLYILFLDSDDLILGGFLTDSLYDYLKESSDKLVDIIYTPKLLCNMNLSGKFSIEYPEDKIDNYLPKLEFWTCLYRRKYLLNSKICFFEYKRQDIESAFRFRAFSNTDNIVVEKNMFFYVHRNNPLSNVHNIDFDTLFEIKAMVYHQLFEEFNDRDIKTTVFLYMQFLSNLKQLFLRNLKLGASKNEINRIINVIVCIKKSSKRVPIKYLPLKYKLFYYIIVLLENTTIFKLYVLICNRKTRITNKSDKSVLLDVDDINAIFKNLKRIETIIYK